MTEVRDLFRCEVYFLLSNVFFYFEELLTDPLSASLNQRSLKSGEVATLKVHLRNCACNLLALYCPYIADISEAVARLLKPYRVGVAHCPGTLHSRLMRIKDRVDPSEQSSIIYTAQCKDCFSNYTGQTSRKLATRLKEHRLAIRNCDIKASLMTAHCVDISWKILSRASCWTARLFQEAWPSNENSINKCIELPHDYSVL